MTPSINSPVTHARFGRGLIIALAHPAIIVRFEHGIESCLESDLTEVADVLTQVATPVARPPIECVARLLALAIRSANETWGVFSSSRIQLLPHQLWVCRKVLEAWPPRWLIADDVGLGKTVEAGLILTALRGANRLRRVLIIVPAGLTAQWQERMLEQFDLRATIYTSESDTATSNFWKVHPYVIASLETLRADYRGRWKRLLEAEPFDAVVVDEAHRLNSREDQEDTLSYSLVKAIVERKRAMAMLFFTGTPHRGHDYAFMRLLELLRPDLISEDDELSDALPHLRHMVIRNNKSLVTNMKGERIFKRQTATTEKFVWSDEERRFYDELTRFIRGGMAYAESLDQKDKRLVVLLLITMQKLASSSIAAIRNALTRRKDKLDKRVESVEAERGQNKKFDEFITAYESGDFAESDKLPEIEAELVEQLQLKVWAERELPGLRTLIELTSGIRSETKIARVMDIIESRFAGRSVLLFTEYKSTQRLVVESLQRRYGAASTVFINGDEALDLADTGGTVKNVQLSRRTAARLFNDGRVRFLVSTEAAGEGIDLQESCHSLIHVDLPWNPMRLHQRVGRIFRFGQTNDVEVVTLHNPETVESKIWGHLDAKLTRITAMFAGVMDEPEDLKHMILGMAPTRLFQDLVIGAQRVPQDGLAQWFDQQTGQLGGSHAVDAVKALFGSSARFDFGECSGRLPRVDLPDLVPFMKAILTVEGRRFELDAEHLTFKVPDKWRQTDFALREKGELLFRRELTPEERDADVDVGGVGHRLLDAALDAAEAVEAALAVVPRLDNPLVMFAVRDTVTGTTGHIKRVVVGVERAGDGLRLLEDWQCIQSLNRHADRPMSIRSTFPLLPHAKEGVTAFIEEARTWLPAPLSELDLSFRLPTIEVVGVLWPVDRGAEPADATRASD